LEFWFLVIVICLDFVICDLDFCKSTAWLENGELPLACRKGMTIALEPKLVFPGKGVVGIENTHVVTENGLKQFSHFEEDIVVC